MDNELIVNTPEKKVKVVEVKYDITELAKHLCCPNKFYHITNLLPTLTNDEAKTLRNQLRSRTGNNHMHFQLEHKFRVKLGEE